MGVCLRSEGSPTSQRLSAVISARRSCSRYLLRSHSLRSTVVQSGGGSPEPPLFFVAAAPHPFELAPAAVTSSISCRMVQHCDVCISLCFPQLAGTPA